MLLHRFPMEANARLAICQNLSNKVSCSQIQEEALAIVFCLQKCYCLSVWPTFHFVDDPKPLICDILSKQGNVTTCSKPPGTKGVNSSVNSTKTSNTGKQITTTKTMPRVFYQWMGTSSLTGQEVAKIVTWFVSAVYSVDYK